MAKRGRRLNQKINERDERGWRVPREGTIRRAVYDRLVAGEKVGTIHEAVGISFMSCIMHKRAITKPERVNALNYNAAHPDEVISVPER